MEQEKTKVLLKSSSKNWGDGQARTVTLVITEDCQLRCKYCYLHGKNKVNKMDFETAKNALEYIFSNRTFFNEKSVIFDFMGGEAFLEIDLVDKISDYIKKRLYELDHPWFNSYRFSFTTNGILYDNIKVQNYIRKNKTHVSIGLTIDGTKRKHDLNRVYLDGRGSYDDVVRNVPLWLKQFPDSSTKVTVASDDLKYIKESILHLWSLGIKGVNINVVFENVWKKGDDKILEEELKSLADYIIDNELYQEYNCSFFAGFIGKKMSANENQNWCGSGKKMIAVDHKGDFYPCNRFLPFSMANKKSRSVGNYIDGLDLNRLRPFDALDRITQSKQECLDCEIASGCALCVGLDYDDADTDTIYQRAVHICDMHKARVRANDYYWERMKNEKGIERQ